MRTKVNVEANVDNLQFGYWDMEIDEFLPISTMKAKGLKKAALALDCSEQLLEAIATLADSISQVVGDDLRDIWRRLEKRGCGGVGVKTTKIGGAGYNGAATQLQRPPSRPDERPARSL